MGIRLFYMFPRAVQGHVEPASSQQAHRYFRHVFAYRLEEGRMKGGVLALARIPR